ncbi:hypothetical protein CCACVL1_30997 [Corchorus capsularis]|uniref:Uncharacterized protein n=1 Tax=Corchorus capsularis TaxID=210143 RepID=A0A1R3FUD8_COCAP|nr:hypothetical protein CCACVL1_30997 [Corchorus capsularis]
MKHRSLTALAKEHDLETSEKIIKSWKWRQLYIASLEEELAAANRDKEEDYVQK